MSADFKKIFGIVIIILCILFAYMIRTKLYTNDNCDQAKTDTAGVLKNEMKFSKDLKLEDWAVQVKKKFDGITIHLSFSDHPSTKAFKIMGGEFEKMTGIRLNWDIMDENSLKDKQFIDFYGNKTYDVVMIDGFWLSEYANKKAIVPIYDFINSDMTPGWYDYNDIIPAYRNGIGKFNNVIYGIPIAGETRVVGYRKDLFQKYAKEPPKTMQEMLELAKFFNNKEDGVYGIAMRAKQGVPFASGFMTIMYNFGGRILDEKTGRPTMNEPGTIDAMNFYIELLKYSPPDVSLYTHEESMRAFASGKTAMWFDATGLIPLLSDPRKCVVSDKINYTIPPKGPGGDAAALAGWNIGIPQSSRNKDAAWIFIAYMTSKLKSDEYVRNSGIPVRTSVYQNKELIKTNPSYPVQLESLKIANSLVDRGISWIPSSPKLGVILENCVGYYGSLALNGKISPQEACLKAQEKIEEIIK